MHAHTHACTVVYQCTLVMLIVFAITSLTETTHQRVRPLRYPNSTWSEKR